MANIWDLIVRVMGDSGQFREDIMQDKATLDELLATISDKDFSIDLNSTDATIKLDELHEKLLAIRDAHANVDIDDADAKYKIDEIKLKIEEIASEVAKIKVDDEDAKLKLDEFKLKFDEIRNEHLKIVLDDKDAIFKADELKLKMDEIHDKHVTITVDEKTRGNTPNASNSSGDAAGGMGLLGSTIMALFPAASPLLSVLVGDTMGLASAFTAASGGVAGFAAVAIPNLKDIFTAVSNIDKAQQAYDKATTNKQRQAALQQEAQAWKGLSDEQKQAVQAVIQFKNYFTSFAHEFQTPVLRIFEEGLRSVEEILNDMKPAITASADALWQLMDRFKAALGTSGVQDFFTWLGQQAGPAIVAFGESAGNILDGFMSLMEAFTPLAGDMENGIVGITQEFANWAAGLKDSDSFKNFVDYVREEGPKIWNILSQLVKLIGQILVDIAPVGSVLLTVIERILAFANSVAKANPQLVTLAGGVLSAVGVFKLLSPILRSFFEFEKLTTIFTAIRQALFGLRDAEVAVSIGEALMDSLNPVGWIALAIAAIVALVYVIYKNWTPIEKWFVDLWNRLKSFFVKWGPDLLIGLAPFIGIPLWIFKHWGEIETWFKNLWKQMLAFFKKWGPDLLIGLAPFIGIPLWIYQHWGQIVQWFTNLWNNVVNGVKGFEKSVTDEIHKVTKAITDIFTNLAKDALHWGENLMHMLANGIGNGISWVSDKVSSAASTIKNFLGFGSPTKMGPGATSDRWMPNLMNMLVDGIEKGTPKVHDALGKVIVPPSVSALMGGASGVSGGGHTFNFNVGNVYGVDGLNQAIKTGVEKHALPVLLKQIQPTARAMGLPAR